MCRVLNVNRNTYYKHFYSKPSPHANENQKINECILHIYIDYHNSIGAYKIRRVLQRDYGINISVGRVYRLMHTMNLPKMLVPKPKWRYSYKDNGPCINYLKQEFYPNKPNSVWASDFTYVRVNGKFCYLCIVLDLFSRKIIGWSVSNNHTVELTQQAFNNAYESRNKPIGTLFHSDRGSEYTAFTFRMLLNKCSILQSFSKKGYPYDNACCESFFKQMKQECLNRKSFHSIEDFKLTCFEYIEQYNSKRPHSTLNYATPNEIENLYMERH